MNARATTKPATPLPWKVGRALNIPPVNAQDIATGPRAIESTSVPGYSSYDLWKATIEADAAYIVHACNAYPQLVEALHDQHKWFPIRFEDYSAAVHARLVYLNNEQAALLRSLGEDA